MIATLEQSQRAEPKNSDHIVASLEGVNKNYGTIAALRDVNFRVHAGEIVALLGPNGAGKTTAVKLLLGLMMPNAGKVRVFGGDPTNPDNRMRTGAMLQVGRVPETLRVREHIDFSLPIIRTRCLPARSSCRGGLENLSNRKFGDLSGGQKQRVLLRCPFAETPICFFWMSPRSDSMSKRAACCGKRFGNS